MGVILPRGATVGPEALLSGQVYDLERTSDRRQGLGPVPRPVIFLGRKEQRYAFLVWAGHASRRTLAVEHGSHLATAAGRRLRLYQPHEQEQPALRVVRDDDSLRMIQVGSGAWRADHKDRAAYIVQRRLGPIDLWFWTLLEGAEDLRTMGIVGSGIDWDKDRAVEALHRMLT